MSNQAPNEARVIPLRPAATSRPAPAPADVPARGPQRSRPVLAPRQTPPAPASKEPLWRDLVGDVLRRERLAQERTLKDVADAARISMPYLSELERGRKEASSEVLAAAARALGLGLGDLLSLTQDELTRLARAGAGRGRTTSTTSTSPTTTTSRYDGMCLAA
ncbi:transcriptional regulator [Streptomyces albiflavescens]|uniref:Transcriptional regulator n=1 Tax=Streptomyces albiflavescens TaxID=1623582 RepID=A0A918D931_9ACTN|nr:helix-turn-helix transcriptional regulator [Streptomyces albiflavescens]GGN89167.1 transcriptional regulator [Streptomyces albiflavescens]